MFSMVPLRLEATGTTAEKMVLWENPKPSSVRFCRPIKFFYAKETTDIARHEVRKTEEEIRNLTPLETAINGEIKLAKGKS